MYDRALPYNELPLLPPLQDIETKAVLRKAITANKALAKLNGIDKILPNPTILVNTITLQEAKSSSLIENIVTTNDELFRASVSENWNKNPHTKEVLRYKTALWQGFSGLKENRTLNLDFLLEVYNLIMQIPSGIRTSSGTKIKAIETGNVIYTPPESEKVIRKKLTNLFEFIDNEADGIDPLIKMAVIHYQFEAIHPFYDGNGRTGRILNVLYLVSKNLLDQPVLYLSKYIIENKADYYFNIKRVTEAHDWERWILFVLEGIEQTAANTVALTQQIMQLFNETLEKVKNETKIKFPKELIEILFEQPYCRNSYIVKRGIASRNSVGNYLNILTEIGILSRIENWKEALFLNIKLYDLLRGKNNVAD